MRNCNNVIAIAQATIQPDGGEQVALGYFLCQHTGPEGEILYGLRVDKRHLEGGLIEREETPPLTGSLADATAMAEAFAKGTVPPCVLLEMVDEWYSQFFPSGIHAAGE
ncbi:MAG: DUF6514 family protein [Defluviitaleaceae bacterium]|nr:DUF6514 family protein [Defluviitaleaceae bacterium]